MRILYLHQYFVTPAMAGGTRSFEMARRLAAQGHDVQMITSDLDGEGPTWRESVEAGFSVHWTPVAYSNAMSTAERLAAFARFAFRAGRRAVSLGGDLVFATSTPLTISLPGVYAARRLGVPFVFEVRDLWPEVPIAMGVLRDPLSRWAARRLERFAYGNAACIVALSPGMKEAVVRTGYRADRVTVIPNGCDLDLFDVGPVPGAELRAATPWLGGRPLVVYIGALGRVNDVGYLVRLAAAVREKDPEVRFAIIGAGSEEATTRKLARDVGVLDHTLFMIGSIPKLKVPGWLSAATAACTLIGPARALWVNATNNKFFDALAAGRPVVSNHGGYQTEIGGEAGAVLQLPRDDYRAASAVLVEFLRSPDRLAAAGVAASRLARERFDRDSQARELEAVLMGTLHREDARVVSP